MTARILIADDEPSLRGLIARRWERRGHVCVQAADGHACLAALDQGPYDFVVLDLRMPGPDGLTCLAEARRRYPDLPVVVLTGHGSIASAVAAMKGGAMDFVTKPCDLHVLDHLLERALGPAAAGAAAPAAEPAPVPAGMVCASPALMQVLRLVHRAAGSRGSVLIEGESGTGKELIARALHGWSPRARHPLVAVNCGALPGSLLESELFGHTRGAFTGASADRPGLVEGADGGTLFLDEAGEMTPEMQAKLLRFLETGEFRRVGENRVRHVDVRVVAATNRSLLDMAREGRFREDLFYRLAVFRVTVPPLRERPEDIPVLARHFLERRGSGHRLSPAALAALRAYDFPGNVRELANLLERAAALADGPVITPDDLQLPGPAPVTAAPDGTGRIATLEAVAREHILAALHATDWNRAAAARLLGISVRTLYRKIEEFGLEEQRL